MIVVVVAYSWRLKIKLGIKLIIRRDTNSRFLMDKTCIHCAAAPFSQPIKKKASQIGRPRHLGLFFRGKIEKRVKVEFVAQVGHVRIHLGELLFSVAAAEVFAVMLEATVAV